MRLAFSRAAGLLALATILVAAVRCSQGMNWGGGFVMTCEDPGCLCDPEAPKTIECFTGKSQLGPCKTGLRRCENFHVSTTCYGEVLAVPEVCNSKDDDCDGVIDDGLVDASDLFMCTAPSCAGKMVQCHLGLSGVCDYGVYKCAPNGGQTCVPLAHVDTEVCNAIDDNCNGVVDDHSCTTGWYCCTAPDYPKVGLCSPVNVQKDAAIEPADASDDASDDAGDDASDDASNDAADASKFDAGNYDWHCIKM